MNEMESCPLEVWDLYDRDEEGIGTPVNMEKAKHWYKKAAEQNHDLAIQKCQDLYLGDE